MESVPTKNPESKPVSTFVLKPKKGTSAWIYFNTETVAKLKEEQKMEQKQAFAKSAEIWKTMNDTTKEPYAAKAKADELRFQNQLKELEEKGFFTTADGQKSTDLYVDPKKKYGEDCVVPKKPLSAYLFFTTAQVNKIKEEQNCTHPEAMKKCGQIWNELNVDKLKNKEDQIEQAGCMLKDIKDKIANLQKDYNAIKPEYDQFVQEKEQLLLYDDKKVYQDKHDLDAQRYKKECNDLDKNGFFMMSDGTKSSEHKSKLKKRAKKGDKEDKKAEKSSKKAKKSE